MKILSKLGALAAVVAFAVLVVGNSTPASATPTTLTVNGSAATSQSVTIGVTGVPVVATFTDEGAAFTLVSTAPATIAYFAAGTSISVNNDGQTITPNVAAPNTTQIAVSDDADATVEPTTVNATLICVAAGSTSIYYVQGGGTSSTITVTCTAAGTNSIVFSNTAPTVGTTVTVTATCTAAGQILTVSVGTLVGTTTCTGAGTIAPTYTCTTAGVITFAINGVANTLNCGTGTTGGLVLSTTAGTYGTVSGTCTAGILLTQTGPASFSGATINGVAVATLGGSVNCTTAGSIVASFTCNTTGTINFALGAASASFVCNGIGTGYNNYCSTTYTIYSANCTSNCAYTYTVGCTAGCPYAGAVGCTGGYGTTANPYNTNVYPQQLQNTPSTLTITSASPSIACGSNAAITVRVMGTNGATVTDGTVVSLTASTGTFSPATATTAAGVVQATYTAPSSIPNTSATLKATAGIATNTTGLSISCTQTTAPAAPVSPPAAYPVQPPVSAPGNFIISPPNTGDAGLLCLEDVAA